MANTITQTATVAAVNHTLIPPTPKTKPPPTSVNFETPRNECPSGAAVCAKPSSLRVTRRVVGWGLLGTIVGLSVREESAMAAKRGPAPAPTEEKKDPNVSGALAKVLASRKRKEAMKEAMAKQRERGKPIDKTPVNKPTQEDETVEKPVDKPTQEGETVEKKPDE